MNKGKSLDRKRNIFKGKEEGLKSTSKKGEGSILRIGV
jgi:hypothetical protein